MSSTGPHTGSSTGPDEGRRADVELRLPAERAYVSVLRTTTAGLAARLDFTIDDIEDLRIAVGEACAMVLPEADPGSPLLAEFYLAPGLLTVRVSVRGADDRRARLRQLRLDGARHPRQQCPGGGRRRHLRRHLDDGGRDVGAKPVT